METDVSTNRNEAWTNDDKSAWTYLDCISHRKSFFPEEIFEDLFRLKTREYWTKSSPQQPFHPFKERLDVFDLSAAILSSMDG